MVASDNVILRIDKHRSLSKPDNISSWSATFDPSRNAVACYVAASTIALEKPYQIPSKSSSPDDTEIVFAPYGEVLPSRRNFIISSYIIFTRLQQFTAENTLPKDRSRLFADVPPPNIIAEYSGISALYRSAIRDHLFNLKNTSQIDIQELGLASTILSVFHIAEIVHLPADGLGDAIVSEEILDWVNQSDPAPSTSEGEELSSIDRPYEHPNFWPYIFTAILRGLTKVAAALLETLFNQENSQLSELVQVYVNLLTSLPRSTSYSLESTFEQEYHIWKRNVHKQRSLLSSLASKLVENNTNNNEQQNFVNSTLESFFRLLAILDGDKDVILEESGEWRTALGAWCLFVHPNLRRDNLPDVMMLILEALPFDLSDPAEIAQTSLICANLPKVVQALDQIDPWIACHLTDLLDKVGIIDQPEDSPATLREWFILAYCDYLYSNPGLWRISMDYLSYCGEIGFARMRRLVLQVPVSLNDDDDFSSSTNNELKDEIDLEKIEDEEIKSVINASSDITKFQDILQACQHFGLNDEAALICRVSADTLVNQRRYGHALAFCYHIGDSRKIAKITETLLDEYIFCGADAFKKLLEEIPDRLLDPSTASAAFSIQKTAEMSHGIGLFDNTDDLFDGPKMMGSGGMDDVVSVLGDAGLSSAIARTTDQKACLSRLAFLGKFRKYLNIYSRGDLTDAGAILVELLSMAPKRFRSALLLDCIPLLQDTTVSMRSEDIFEILRVLQDVVDPIISNNGEDIYGDLNVLASLSSSSSSSSSLPSSSTQQNGNVKNKQLAKEVHVKESLKQFDVLRYAASKHLAHSFQLEM